MMRASFVLKVSGNYTISRLKYLYILYNSIFCFILNKYLVEFYFLTILYGLKYNDLINIFSKDKQKIVLERI